MSFRTLRTGGLVATALVLALTAQPALAVQPALAAPGDVANVAHRGASHKAPENTMPAMAQAVADHADYVGIDVRLTRDGVPVVIHDSSLRRTTNVEDVFPGRRPWLVDHLTLDQIEQLDTGRWRSPGYSRERVPTLARVLRELAHSPTGVLLEVKKPRSYGGPGGIGRAVMETVEREWPGDLAADRRLVVQSFDKRFLERMHELYPEVLLGLQGLADGRHMQRYPFADNVQVRADTITQEYVDEAHARGVLVGAWTVDSRGWMHDLVRLGIDSLSTNRPDRLHDVLTQRGLVSDPERWQRTATTTPAWQVAVPSRAARGSRVRVTATLTGSDGSPARWQWAAVQLRSNGAWETTQMRATNSRGRFRTTVALSRGIRLRVTSTSDGDYPVVRSTAREVEVRKVRSALSLSGEQRIRRGETARLKVRWRASDGRSVTGTATLWARHGDSRWRPVRDVRVRHGSRTLRLRPRWNTRYRLHGGAGWWFKGDADRHRVVVTRTRRR